MRQPDLFRDMDSDDEETSTSNQNRPQSTTEFTGDLTELFLNSHVALRRGHIFSEVRAKISLATSDLQSRIEGMLIGLAVGDALGHSTEWKYDPEKRTQEYGTITDHVGTFMSPPGRISDDTQMSFWTLERLLANGRLDVSDLARCFVERRNDIVGMGRNTGASLKRHDERIRTGSPAFHLCGGDPRVDGRGNGALMRYAPLVLPHLSNPSPQVWSDVVLASILTHPHTAALSSVVAFAKLLWQMFELDPTDAPRGEWWLDEYLQIADDLEVGPFDWEAGPDKVPAMFENYRGTLCDFLDTKVRRAWQTHMSIRDACSPKGFGSGADCLQTVPAVLYILMSHSDSFESAIITAVNDTKDNDTIASIIGALLGALHGRDAIRQRWINGIRSSSLAAPGGLSGDDRTLIRQLATDAARRFGE